MIKHIQNGTVEPDELIEKCGVKAINAAHNAAKDLNGLGEQTDWYSLLERTAIRFDAGSQLEQYGRKLKRGEDVDLSRVAELVRATEVEHDYGVVSITEVQRQSTPFKPSGWEGFDQHFGGLPISGLVTCGGPPGTGKTTLWLQMAGKFLEFYNDETVLFFSLEMPAAEVRERLREVNPNMTKQQAKRFRIYDRTDLDKTKLAIIADKEQPGLAGLDFADLFLQGGSDPSKMEELYRFLTVVAKDGKFPFWLIAQLSGNYQGGIPRPHHLRWTRLAEALSWMVLMVYNPTRDHFPSFDEDDELLPPLPGYAYLIGWKIRGEPPHQGPGALRTRFRGDRGFAKNGNWFTLKKI
jgi:hypothetical protein